MQIAWNIRCGTSALKLLAPVAASMPISSLGSIGVLPLCFAARAHTAAALKRPGDLRVAIVGAGVGGPVLAMLLKKHLGCTPVVFEAAHAIKEVGAGISLAPNGLRVLDSINPSLAQKVYQEVGEPLQVFHVTRPNDKDIVTFPTKAMESYGFPMIGVRRFRLLNALHDSMQQMGIPLQLGKRLADIHHSQQQSSSAYAASVRNDSKRGDNSSSMSSSSKSGGGNAPATLVFEDGSSFEADLVVGCDGVRSRTRAIVKGGQEPPPTYTGDEVILCVTMDRNHDLVPPNVGRFVYGPGNKQFGAYGLGPDMSWFTVMRREQSSDTWGPVADAAAIEAAKEELRPKYEGWKFVQRVLDRDVAVMIRVGIFDRDPTPVWSSGVVTLLGDAASPIPPHLGQGGNKAMEDAGVLVAALAKHEGNIPAALRQYEALRHKRAATLLAQSRNANKVANMQHPLAVAARDALLRSIVRVKGTIPSDWLWEYDCAAAVQGGTV